ncbi:hypothetical protein DOTSEDRAFT_26295 [Dothistroma septosporum NZE10]|uniref:BTB domain-containing protein n=1 Tax=Dothistroma septosporum (strain NZE10 / CBS 128990) TaxID=675120 RepID=N1PKW6_DOTSN|nr:hypothetical protein DOTSEDRAFT_26295 [Dothistroma septosporum NZE10]
MSSTTSAAKSILPGYVSPCHQFLKLATNKGGLYESGDHSDLLVRSQDGREFRVHKCIVASKSGFFKGACRGGFKAQSGVIEVEEDGEVMDALFRHIYEAPIEWLPTGADTNDVLSEKATVQTLLLTKKLRAASEKACDHYPAPARAVLTDVHSILSPDWVAVQVWLS